MQKTIKDEKDWQACAEPDDMIWFLREQFRTKRKKYGQRKARLFVVACCRRVWSLMKDERSRHAIEILERYADGNATPEELLSAELDAAEVENGFVMTLGFVRHVTRSTRAQIDTPSKRPLPVWEKAHMATYIPSVSSKRAEKRMQAKLLRDIFGNPFDQISIDRTHQTAEVVELAQTIYDQNRFQNLPILGKALRQAGCTEKTILNHCRTKGPHVRGCWVLDVILTKRSGRNSFAIPDSR